MYNTTRDWIREKGDKNMETAGDPCNKQNLECATDFACLVRF